MASANLKLKNSYHHSTTLHFDFAISTLQKSLQLVLVFCYIVLTNMLDFVEPFVLRGVHVDQALVSLCSIFGAFLLFLSFLFWPLRCLSFDIKFLITPLISYKIYKHFFSQSHVLELRITLYIARGQMFWCVLIWLSSFSLTLLKPKIKFI